MADLTNGEPFDPRMIISSQQKQKTYQLPSVMNGSTVKIPGIILKGVFLAMAVAVLPVLQKQSPQLVMKYANTSAITRSWELVNLLFIGLAISYGLIARRATEPEKEKLSDEYVQKMFEFADVFDECRREEEDNAQNQNKTQQTAFSSKWRAGEDLNVLIADAEREKPLLLPVRSLKHSLSNSESHDFVEAAKNEVCITTTTDVPKIPPAKIMSVQSGNFEEDVSASNLAPPESAVFRSPVPWSNRSFKENGVSVVADLPSENGNSHDPPRPSALPSPIPWSSRRNSFNDKVKESFEAKPIDERNGVVSDVENPKIKQLAERTDGTPPPPSRPPPPPPPAQRGRSSPSHSVSPSPRPPQLPSPRPSPSPPRPRLSSVSSKVTAQSSPSPSPPLPRRSPVLSKTTSQNPIPNGICESLVQAVSRQNSMEAKAPVSRQNSVEVKKNQPTVSTQNSVEVKKNQPTVSTQTSIEERKNNQPAMSRQNSTETSKTQPAVSRHNSVEAMKNTVEVRQNQVEIQQPPPIDTAMSNGRSIHRTRSRKSAHLRSGSFANSPLSRQNSRDSDSEAANKNTVDAAASNNEGSMAIKEELSKPTSRQSSFKEDLCSNAKEEVVNKVEEKGAVLRPPPPPEIVEEEAEGDHFPPPPPPPPPPPCEEENHSCSSEDGEDAEVNEVDRKAEEFIARFKEQIKLQREQSLREGRSR